MKIVMTMAALLLAGMGWGADVPKPWHVQYTHYWHDNLCHGFQVVDPYSREVRVVKDCQHTKKLSADFATLLEAINFVDFAPGNCRKVLKSRAGTGCNASDNRNVYDEFLVTDSKGRLFFASTPPPFAIRVDPEARKALMDRAEAEWARRVKDSALEIDLQ